MENAEYIQTTTQGLIFWLGLYNGNTCQIETLWQCFYMRQYFYHIICSVDVALKHVYLHRHHKMYFINIGLLFVFSEKLHVFLMKAMPCCGPLIIGAILLHGTTTNIYLIVAFTVMKRHVQRKLWQISFNWMNNYLKDMEELSIDEISSFHFHQYC